MVFFGILSALFGMLKIQIPGIVGVASDLRELPLIIGIFNFQNPIYAIGLSAITILTKTVEGSYYSSIISHSTALMIFWVFFYFLKKQKTNPYSFGLLGGFFVCIYYMVFLIPLLIITNHLFGLNTDKYFIAFYYNLLLTVRFEIIGVVLITMFYLVQHKLQLNLKIYKKNLEDVVEERTAYLNSVIEELKLTQQYLVQNEKMISLGTFSAGIVHEINNPLNFISGGIQLISELKNEISKNKTVDFNERFENAINFINEGLFKTTSIVKALQSFTSRTTSKRIDSDIHKIIENSLLFLNFSIPENVSIIKNYHLKAKIPVFEDEIHQVIIEILRNALFELNKKTQKDSAIDITTSENEEFAILTISNNGGEIPEQYLSRVFDPFFTTKEPGEGVGLGLSIVYTFITEHKGKIRVENSNTWVKFIIELPFKN